MNKRFLILFILGVCILSCTKKTAPKTVSSANTVAVNVLSDIPDKTVNKSELYYNRKKSIWTLDDQLYSGYAVTFYEDSTSVKEKFGILNGKKQNQAIEWYSDGHYKRITDYNKGKPHGDKKTWSPDSLHVLVSHFKYVSGKVHGEQKKWYPTGELFKKMNFNMGKEEGMQQAFRKNGDLYANYEARKGRIFGLKKASLCYSLNGENVQYRKK
ncbi:toxin-antitoxin system YwqK family antitoxin [Aquimarina pacifica]|uniref:toxin-antitoxin system YwqK family antitoxin n=1 Tax=Aquimarina pacifica TaxID=1296415 RepID=UPI0004704EFD|nr:hypothetical protein [Aquimarina pacifica]